MAKLNKNLSEPSILVKPISRFGGLDNIHIALVVLVVILILLIVAISSNTRISVVNQTAGNCTYGTINGTCVSPIHTSAQAKLTAEKILAGYSTSNTSLSVLPYLSNVNAANISYLNSTKQWYVTIPYNSPLDKKSYTLGIVISDVNMSKFSTFVQAVNAPTISNNYVIAPGVIKIASQPTCSTGKPLQMYWFIDPYAPGSMQSLVNETKLQSKYGTGANITVKILYSQASQIVANTYGLNNTLNLGEYILCGSVQNNFTGFVHALNASYSGTYMPAYILSGIAGTSGFNMSSLNSCITSSSQRIMNVQALQAQRFNVTSSSAVVTDCQYLSIPQTAQAAACYANSLLC